MTMKEIGTLIRKGMSTEDIQKQIRDFPTEVTTEYFQRIGYERVESIKYKWMLRKNNAEKKKEKARGELDKNDFIISENADPNNILIDVCALGFKNGLEVIERSKKVSVLYETIKEMDKVADDKRKVKKPTKNDIFLMENIKHYVRDMLLKKDRYRLIPYENNELDYCDDKIIEYLKSKSPRNRQTLLTADKILALKAYCLGFDFILTTEKLKPNNDKGQEEILNEEGAENEKSLPKDKKIQIFGVHAKVSFENRKITIENCKKRETIATFVVKGECCQEIVKRTEIDISDFEYIVILQRMRNKRKVRIDKIYLEKTKIIQEQEECEFINDIYKLDLHLTVQNRAKTLLIT